MSVPSLLICGFRSFPAAPRNPAAEAVGALRAQAWTPIGVATRYLSIPVDWEGSVETVKAELREAPVDGVLLVGVAVKAEGFRVETQARNRTSTTTPDDRGALRPDQAVSLAAPACLPTTSPTAAMVEAVARLGLPAAASDDAGDYLCNFTLYRLLERRGADRIGFLHVPQVREFDAAAAFTLAHVVEAVRAAAQALATDLARRKA